MVRRFPSGLRTISPPKRDGDSPKVHQDTCGRGDKIGRALHLDELDER